MKILVILNHHNSFSILNLCLLLQKKDKKIKFFAVTDSKFLNIYKDKIDKYYINKIIFDNNDTEQKDVEKKENINQGLISILIKTFHHFSSSFLSNSTLYLYFRELFITRKMNYFKKKSLSLLSNTQPELVLSISDRTYDYIESPILWAAKKVKIPIVLTYSNQFDINSSLSLRKSESGEIFPQLSCESNFSIYKYLAIKILKRQIIQNTFFQNTFVLMSAKKTGILSYNSWWVGNGLSDKVIVDSHHSKLKYIENNVNISKIDICGHPEYDMVYSSYLKRKEIKTSLYNDKKLDSKLPLIIFAIPQFAEQGIMSWEKHWEILFSYLEVITRLKVNLFLSLHPRMQLSKYKYLEDKYKCFIIKGNLSDYIGSADIFIASNSTVISWSILCNIKTVIIYSPIKSLLSHLNSIFYEPDPKKLNKLLAKILQKKNHINKIDFKTLSRKEVFFGKSLDLHYKCFKKITEEFKKNS